ncbi:ABC-2 type transport system ATP-binding protein [Butyrivibrio sp. ob235]|uniref:ABC transporter ATP-binding protein n=1 Tax=Butyrivibrio sp. ob235 TaxID=1761780 RepID=UPI0008D21B7F|nr:ATP-binding cassette domain-containing protein [Butyrivibrio sp. ob235]SEL56421.1 ABC-2 type transport system ATP-binding protein [Butyrivibrio sp. ob235]
MSIEVNDLTKIYKMKKHQKKIAVDNISFSIPKGEIVGFTGPNGAGKSTTIKMMTGILSPDNGSISIDGLNFKKNRKQIMMKTGVVFGQKCVLCWDIPVIDSLKLFKDMYHVPDVVFRENMDKFSEILGLDEFIGQPPRLLSLGQRMKADLAASLIYNPDILFLDEPTIGIDVLSKERIRQFIKRINEERHTTIILTTHDVSDIESLCEKMIIIDKGSLIYDGTLPQLKTIYRTTDLEEIIKRIYLAGEEKNAKIC